MISFRPACIDVTRTAEKRGHLRFWLKSQLRALFAFNVLKRLSLIAVCAHDRAKKKVEKHPKNNGRRNCPDSSDPNIFHSQTVAMFGWEIT